VFLSIALSDHCLWVSIPRCFPSKVTSINNDCHILILFWRRLRFNVNITVNSEPLDPFNPGNPINKNWTNSISILKWNASYKFNCFYFPLYHLILVFCHLIDGSRSISLKLEFYPQDLYDLFY
jgi:hypothetical protein